MKTLVTLFVVLLIAAALSCSSPDAAQDITGFRGFSWGYKLQKNDSIFTVILREEHRACGERRGENLKIGDATLSSITYGFGQDKLSYVVITCEGYWNFRALLSATTEKYGAYDQPNEDILTYYWVMSRGAGALEYNESSEVTKLCFYSKVMAEEERLFRENEAKKPKDDF